METGDWDFMLIMSGLLLTAVFLVLYLLFSLRKGTGSSAGTASNADLDSLFEQQPEAWVIMDGITGEAIRANQKAMNLFGVYRQGYLSKLRFAGMFSEDLNEDEVGLLLDAVDNNTFANKLLECRAVQGRAFKAVVSISRIQEGNLFCRFAEPMEQAIPVPEPVPVALPQAEPGVKEADISHLQPAEPIPVPEPVHAPVSLVVPGEVNQGGAITPMAVDAIAVIGSDQSFIEVNTLFAALTGYEIAELKNLSFEQLVYPTEVQLHTNWFSELADGKYRVARTQRTILTRTGKKVQLELLGASMPSRNAVIITALDNSRRHEEFEILMRSRDNLSALIENTAEAVFSLDAIGRVTVINSRYSELFNLRYGLMIEEGSSYEELLGADERKIWKERFRKVLQGYREVYREEFTGPGGQKLMYEVLLYPVRDERGLITGITYSGRDITERIAQELALQEAKDKAEEATRAKSDFLAVMSHEIRTPLNGLMGMTGLLNNTSLNAEQKEFVDIIRLSGEALLQVIGDILDFSKIEANRMQLELAPFRVGDAMKETLDILSGRARDKGLSLQMNLDSALPEFVVGDKARLRQILMNLAGNAIKFTDKGHVSLKVRLLSEARGEKELEFSVQDSGIGIAPEQASRLFMPYSQADASTYRQFGGTGLGLAICRNLVDLMGGRIWVESQPGKGSNFLFTIKVKPYEGVSPEVKVTPEQDANASQSRSTDLLASVFPMQILIAEDNDINRLLATKLFERLGYTIDAVANGKLAFEAVQSGNYDMVFMDVQMPEMNGQEASVAIRAALKEKVQPVIIAMTAFAGEDEKAACLQAGMNDHISKPIMIDDIESMIRKWANQKHDSMKKSTITRSEDTVSDVPVLNQAALQRLMDIGRQTDPGFLQQILDMFMKQAPKDIAEIKEALEKGDFASLWKTAHKLKGTCLNIGASRLGALCRELESKGKGLEISGLHALCLQLDPAYRLTIEELKSLFEYN